MTVAHWIAAVIILVLVVGLSCFIAGWVQHSNYARAYEVQRRVVQALPSIGQSETPAPPAAAPAEIHVHLHAPVDVARVPMVIDGDIVDVRKAD
jgi:hypothetical protein